MARRAFVTGAGGFLGQHTAAALAKAGWEVIGIGPGGEGKNAQPCVCGISHWEKCRVNLYTLAHLVSAVGTPDAVLHCAGSGSVPFSLSHPREDFVANVVTTLDIVEFCRQYAPQAHLVFPSSAAVYGNAGPEPLAEDGPRHPVSPYGVHKAMAEDLCHSYAVNYGICISVIRFFSLYGPGLRKQLLWDACGKARDNAFSFWGSGAEVRDWLHIHDAARLMVEAIDLARPDCLVVNGGTGVGIPIRRIVQVIGNAWTPRRVPAFSGEKRVGDPTCYVADCSRLSSLGFLPRISLDEGIAHYVSWFKTVQE